jgi:hypothetical protein
MSISAYDVARFWSRIEVRKQSQCWPWRYGTNESGYGEFRCEGGEDRGAAHRIAYTITKGDIPAGLIVRHSCDNPLCCNPDHLEIGTHQDNVADRVSRNRSAIGEDNGRAKLSEEDVRRIRRSPLSNETLARTFKVDPSTIKAVRTGDTWKHV